MPLRFDLRTLLAALLMLSICFALIAWRLLLGTVLSVIFLSLVVVIIGIIKRRRRFARAGFAVAILMLLLLAYDMAQYIYWSGEYRLDFDVTVVDSETGAPIPGAVVNVLPSLSVRTPPAPAFAEEANWEMNHTDASGRVRFYKTYSTGGERSGLEITAGYRPRYTGLAWRSLIVDAKGYEFKAVTLGRLYGTAKWPASSPLPPITIELQPVPSAPENEQNRR